MTNNQLTKEWLQQTIAELESVRDEIPFGIDTNSELELAAFKLALAAMDSEPVRNPVLSYADSYRDMAKQGVESVPIWSVITDLERNIAPLYHHAQQPVVDADDNFYSWFGREWQENYQHNQYTTAAKQMLGVMAESAWKAGHRAAMLQAGNSPVIPDGLIAAVNRLLDSDGSRGCYSAIRCHDARAEVERLLAAAPQEVPDGK
ncbi:hypothetical protein AF48_02747 [Klebsiella aerogenes MGH 62]|uniref:hypothetical protein n=1 Tax=Klebsiella aerogenes TaxID=548 RepID=UPI0004A17568|nr:hypothetical protein [Klebsiella aerogenes]KDF21783.1 hypothetical protein AF48_02747 [Klebsiella aerogenes MGH 62]